MAASAAVAVAIQGPLVSMNVDVTVPYCIDVCQCDPRLEGQVLVGLRRSSRTTSRQRPRSLPRRSRTPTTRNPQASCSRMLGLVLWEDAGLDGPMPPCSAEVTTAVMVGTGAECGSMDSKRICPGITWAAHERPAVARRAAGAGLDRPRIGSGRSRWIT
jgi:hypothetical protein